MTLIFDFIQTGFKRMNAKKPSIAGLNSLVEAGGNYASQKNSYKTNKLILSYSQCVPVVSTTTIFVSCTTRVPDAQCVVYANVRSISCFETGFKNKKC